MISYIVSAYNRTEQLPICLRSLALQTRTDLEILVTDNSRSQQAQDAIRSICEGIGAPVRYMCTQQPTCYHSAELGVAAAQGDFVCFPSDDSYYVPFFGEWMERKAAEATLDLVYCNILYGSVPLHLPHNVLDVAPQLGRIDKTSFILRRSCFLPFPDKRDDGQASASDGALIEKLVANASLRHGKVSDVLVVHN